MIFDILFQNTKGNVKSLNASFAQNTSDGTRNADPYQMAGILPYGSQPCPHTPPGFLPFGIPGLQGYPMFRPPMSSVSSVSSGTSTSDQDNSMYSLFHEMSTRLKSIEQSVSKIAPIEKDMAYLKLQMSDIQNSNASLSLKIQEVERSCQYNGDVFDKLICTQEQTDYKISQLQIENQKLATRLDNIELEYSKLNNKCLENQSKLMENGLIIFGVQEVRPSVQSRNESHENS